MAKLEMTEHDIQVHIFDTLRLNEMRDPRLKWIYAVPNGNYRSWKIGANLKAEGVTRGVSDICLPFPGRVAGNHYYVGAYIEMKAGDNKLTPEQEEFLQFVSIHGYATGRFWHFDPALDFIEEYCGIRLRGRERLPRRKI